MGIEEKLKRIPDLPGVYLFKDAQGRAIYIGKASSLRQRVKSYFQPSRGLGPRIEAMVSSARDVEWFVMPSQAEALLFEANLIKEHRPKYNVAYRDDKSYPFIKITMAEEFPRILVARGEKSDGSLYFGPYSNAKLLREAVKSIRRTFPFRTCNPLPKKACVYYDLGLCPAPCEGRISKEEYGGLVKRVTLFIEGKKDELVKEMSERMKSLAGQRRFEEASSIRDQIRALGKAVAKKPRVDARGQVDELEEVLGLRRRPRRIEAFDISNIRGEGACGSMVAFRDGRPDKSRYRMFKIRQVEGQDDYAMMREVVRRRYTGALREKHKTPDLIIIDGGRGHLSAAASEIRKAGLARVPIIGIAKTFEHLYTLGRDTPIALAPSSKALQLIQRVRDESHRFAIRYHHILRRKAFVGDVKAKKRKRRTAL